MSNQNNLSQKDVHLVSDLHAAMQEEKHPGMFSVLIILFAFLLTLLIWSYNSVVEEVTRGQGSIIPSSREQVIQSLDPGILSEMLVKEGDLVEKDQVLLRLDNTRSTAVLRESQARLHNLLAIAARLTAEAYDKPLVFSDDIPKDVQDRERLVYQTRLNALKDSVDGLENNKMYLDKEIKMTKPLVSKGAISEVELLRMQRQSGELALQILERKNRYTAEANNELVRIKSDISQLKETVKRLEDPVAHAELKAPLKGVVKNIRINTIGGVISAGQDIMEIVPVDETLLVEAYITPRDVAYVTPGMKAVVKLTAYDYALYGGLDGEVTLLSPGALHAMKRPSDLNLNPNEAFYRVIVRTNSDSKMTDKNGKVLPIIPGMIASVDIKTGEKTIFQYLIKPITRMKQALSER